MLNIFGRHFETGKNNNKIKLQNVMVIKAFKMI